MKQNFSPSQISRIIDQSLAFECACPAQVCRAIFELRDLHRYQMNCLQGSQNDALVHQAIADATERSHALMEECLTRVLEIEGWDAATLAMPAQLKARQLRSL